MEKLELKRCTVCLEPFPLAGFGSRPDLPSGRDTRCKSCISQAIVERHRYNVSLPLFMNRILSWPATRLEAELEWEKWKVEALMDEIARRKKS